VVSLLVDARRAAGLSQAELARRAGTSRPTLSAYEHGRTVPTLRTAQRVLAAAGFELVAIQRPVFLDVVDRGGRVYAVPDRLPRLPVAEALRTVELPEHVVWSGQARFRLADRADRARAYEIVLREGRGEDIAAIVDGVLLVDVFDELVLPRDLRAAWQPLIDAALGSA